MSKTSIQGILGQFESGCNAQKMFNALCEHPYGLTWRELTDILWGDDADGGPLTASNNLQVLAVRFNAFARQKRASIRIKSGQAGGAGTRFQIWIVRENQ